MLSRLFMPKETVNSVFDIDLDALKKRGIKLIIADIDGTLESVNTPHPRKETIEWIETVQVKGFMLCLVSNNNEKRVTLFNENLRLHAIHGAMKPFKHSFREVLKRFDTHPSMTCVIGDKPITDILGANRMGMHSILVTPSENRKVRERERALKLEGRNRSKHR